MNKKISFGTDGVRGNANAYPFTPEALKQLVSAIVYWHREMYPTNPTSLLVCTDTRESCPRIKKILFEQCSSLGTPATDAGILPTPALLTLMKQKPQYTLGLIISASHNVYTDNGIKLFKNSGKLSAQDEHCIEKYANMPSPKEIKQLTKQNPQNWLQAAQAYTDTVASFFPSNFLVGKKIVLDCAHGALYQVAPTVFTALGATIICHGTEPNGTNINEKVGALHPEELKKLVKAHNADCGFAFDGDGDRVIAVSSDGVIKDGDDLLCLLLEHPRYKKTRKLVGTIMTNGGLQAHLATKKIDLIRTKVGDKYIAQALHTHQSLIGGESSGHIILKDYHTSGDGLFVALRVLEVLCANNNWKMITFDKHPQILINVPVGKKKDLTTSPFVDIIEQHKKTLINGRTIIRYSGTENVLRVMTEDIERELAWQCAQQLALKLQQELNG